MEAREAAASATQAETLTTLRACLCSLLDPTLVPAAQTRITGTEDAWHSLLDLAKLHGTAPLLFAAIRDWPQVPADIHAELHTVYRRNGLRNTFLLYEYGRVTDLLASAGIPIIGLKGVALAETLYQNLALRPMQDIDILIARHDLPRAAELLLDDGYAVVGHDVHRDSRLDFENEVALVKKGPVPSVIELHWNLIDSPYYQQALDLTWFWQTTRAVDDASPDRRRLGDAAQLIHLCAHLMLHHRGQGLLWQYDIATLLHDGQAEFDWCAFVRRVEQCQLTLACRTVLQTLVNDWAAPVPAAVLAKLNDVEPMSQERRTYDHLTTGRRPVVQRFWADLAALNSWRRRLRFALQNLFPAPAYMRARYDIPGRLLLPAYYPYRWLRGIWEWIRFDPNG